MPDYSRRWQQNLESDPVRPEVAAFRELDTLVRNLTDQLAGYRRRALAAESRARDLELNLERAVEKGEAALAAARAETSALRRLLEDANTHGDDGVVGEVFPAVGSSAASSAGSERRILDSADLSAYGDIAVENERLRARLGEARDRTNVLVERVRFLRQQMTQGAEK